MLSTMSMTTIVRMMPRRGTSSSFSRSKNVRLMKPVAITTKKMHSPLRQSL